MKLLRLFVQSPVFTGVLYIFIFMGVKKTMGFETAVIFGITFIAVDTSHIVRHLQKIQPPAEVEYEMFLESQPDDSIKIDGWYPIAKDMIKHPEKIPEYIRNGRLRVRR